MTPKLAELELTPAQLATAKSRIEQIAYQKWEEAGSPQGESERYWMLAEEAWIQHEYVPPRQSGVTGSLSHPRDAAG